MFLDIVNYTRKTSRLNHEGLNKLHEIFDSICLPIFNRYNGNVIKKIGDAFLVTFKSTTDSLNCAIRLQETYQEYNKKFRKFPIHIRIAIHHGEVLLRKNDVYGDAVNITSRIEGLTKPKDIVFSETVLKNIKRNEFPIRYIGAHKLKGVSLPMRLFKIVPQNRKSNFWNIFLEIIFILIVLALVLFFIYSMQ